MTDQPQLIVYKHSELFNSLDSETRNQIEEQVFTEKYASVNGIDQEKITWLDSGKPQIANSNLQISIHIKLQTSIAHIAAEPSCRVTIYL